MKLTRENKRMKKLVKKQIMYIITIACFVLAFCLCPIQKTEAEDGGEDYPYGMCEILKFNGKNATWNLRKRVGSPNWCYSIETGKRSNTWKNVKLVTSNPSVVETFAEEAHYEENTTYVSLNLEPKNPGKTTVTLSFKSKGKNYKYKFKVIVRKDENPFERVKIGNKNIKTQYDDGPYVYKDDPDAPSCTEAASLKLEKGTHKMDIRMKKNWKLISIKNGETNITKSKKVKVSGKGTELKLIVQNEKTGERLSYYVHIISLTTNKTSNTILRLNKSNISMYVTGSAKITATCNKNSQKITWSSSNSKVVTVKNGVVTAKKAGTAVITASCNGVKKTCRITVKEDWYNKVLKSTSSYRVKNYINGKIYTIYRSRFDRYCLYDINKDGIKELLLYNDYEENALFTFYNGKVTPLIYGTLRGIYVKGKYLIVQEGSSMSSTYYVYVIEKGKLKLICKLFETTSSIAAVPGYSVNGKKCSRATFMKSSDKYLKNMKSLQW